MPLHHKIFLKLFLSTILIFASHSAYAIQWVGEGGMHFGGDEVTVVNANSEPDSFKAGEFMTLAIGPQFTIATHSKIRMLLGWKFNAMDMMNNSSGDVKFSRYPLDVLYFYQTKQWNFGAGVSYHLNPEVSRVSTNLEYKDALGYVVEVDFRLGQFFYLGGKYTMIDYEQKTNNTTINGNSMGIVMGFVFGK